MKDVTSFEPPRGMMATHTVHVLEILGIAKMGGMESYVHTLVRALSADRFRVSCLVPYEGVCADELRRTGCAVSVVALRDDPYWRSIEAAADLVRRDGVDVIHAHLPSAHVLAGLVGRITRRPVVATIHGMAIEALELGISQTVGSHLVAVCAQAHRQALALGVPPARVSLIPNGVDLERFRVGGDGAAFRRAHGVPPDAQFVGWVGRLAPEKGPDQFLRVAELVLRRRPDVYFGMVGAGPMADDLATLARRLGLDDRLRFVGMVADTAPAYHAFDVLAQTSRSEGMPLVLLEAMACGRAVAAIDVGGVPEVVAVDETGLLAAPGDCDWLAKCLVDLLDRPARLHEMGGAARRRAEENFDVRVAAGRTADLFARLAGPAPGRKRRGMVVPSTAPLSRRIGP